MERDAHLPALHHQHGFQAEGRKGGEAAKQADGEQQADRLARRRIEARQPSGEQPHGEPADDVRGERPPGPGRTGDHLNSETPDQIAQCRSDSAPCHDEKDIGHAARPRAFLQGLGSGHWPEDGHCAHEVDGSSDSYGQMAN